MNTATQIESLIQMRDEQGADVQAEIDRLFQELTGTETTDPFSGPDYDNMMARLG